MRERRIINWDKIKKEMLTNRKIKNRGGERQREMLNRTVKRNLATSVTKESSKVIRRGFFSL